MKYNLLNYLKKFNRNFLRVLQWWCGPAADEAAAEEVAVPVEKESGDARGGRRR
jgi:hypothetical protein